MTLKEVYQRFLDLPNPIGLADNASLHYITTLNTFSSPADIVRHLETQNKKVVRTKSTKIISAVEGSNAIALDVETILEFISGGGSYLPGLENFIVDKVAVIPTTHVVHFDAARKISQIRISWDQGSLLRQTEVIGSRGRNWPVYDGKDQIRLIKTSSTAAPTVSEPAASPRGRSEQQSVASSRNVSPSKRHIKDPYASLDLFSPKQPTDENERISSPNAVAPRASARPPPREMSELFAAGHEDHEPDSPKKKPVEVAIAPKAGGNQKFTAPRLFSDDPDEPAAVGYKSNPAKYNHFSLGDPEEYDSFQHQEPETKPKSSVPFRAQTTKHSSQWDFADFSTPPKVSQKVRDQDVVHFSLNTADDNTETPRNKAAGKPRRDNETHFEMQDDGTPVQRNVVPKPRKDAETHFQFKDTATPVPNRTSNRPSSSSSRMGLYSNNVIEDDTDDQPNGKAPRSTISNNARLYSNNVIEDDTEDQSNGKAPLSTITNNANHRRHDFDNHGPMTEESHTRGKTNDENKHISNHRKQPSQMDTHWGEYNDDSPEPAKKAPSQAGLRRGMESHWSMGEDDQPTTNTRAKKGNVQKSFWDF